MIEYRGIQSQQRINNTNSVLLLALFPILLLGMFWIIVFFLNQKQGSNINFFTTVAPIILVATGIWFLIAWGLNTKMIQWATGSKPLDRMENKRVYNIVENLCISCGMKMPAVYVIEDDSMNAFASGINASSYSVTLSRGIINKLSDEELEGVVAHELTHIRNRDTRMLIISIIFVGVFSFLAEMAFRSIRFAGGRKSGKGTGVIILVAVVVSALAYLISMLLRFGISRSREYMADAGAAEMTKRPEALASALKKISDDPWIEAVQSRDVAQLFINNPTPSQHKASWDNLFSTHPPIEKRIEYLEQFL